MGNRNLIILVLLARSTGCFLLVKVLGWKFVYYRSSAYDRMSFKHRSCMQRSARRGGIGVAKELNLTFSSDFPYNILAHVLIKRKALIIGLKFHFQIDRSCRPISDFGKAPLDFGSRRRKWKN